MFHLRVTLLMLVATATGQVCVKRFVGGKWRSSGDCGRQGNSQSVVNELRQKAERELHVTPLPKTCDGIDMNSAKSRNATGGVFDINITDVGVTEVYCDVKTDGGNWTVFQRRIDGSVDFYRNWTEYAKGFGNTRGELWLGLDAIHQLTRGGDCELRVDMVTTNGTSYYAKYRSFQVGSPSDNYTLNVTGYSGNLRDSLEYHNSQPFSTKGRDNDANLNKNCAVERKGAWWYNKCADSNLNGNYHVTGWSGVAWIRGKTWIRMKSTTMMLRKKN